MPDLQRRDLAGSLVRARHDQALESVAITATLQADPTATATAVDIVDFARAQLDADYASITVIRSRKRLETIGPTDPVADRLDHAQSKLREGPCYDTAWHSQILSSTNLAADGRWPRWAAQATHSASKAFLPSN